MQLLPMASSEGGGEGWSAVARRDSVHDSLRLLVGRSLLTIGSGRHLGKWWWGVSGADGSGQLVIGQVVVMMRKHHRNPTPSCPQLQSSSRGAQRAHGTYRMQSRHRSKYLQTKKRREQHPWPWMLGHAILPNTYRVRIWTSDGKQAMALAAAVAVVNTKTGDAQKLSLGTMGSRWSHMRCPVCTFDSVWQPATCAAHPSGSGSLPREVLEGREGGGGGAPPVVYGHSNTSVPLPQAVDPSPVTPRGRTVGVWYGVCVRPRYHDRRPTLHPIWGLLLGGGTALTSSVHSC